MTRDYGVQIGKSLGNVIDVEVPNDGVGWGKYLRVRIEISLLKAIARARIIMVNGNREWVSFRYEKLPRICSQCGWILHRESRYTVGSSQRGIAKDANVQFGARLSVDSKIRRNLY